MAFTEGVSLVLTKVLHSANPSANAVFGANLNPINLSSRNIFFFEWCIGVLIFCFELFNFGLSSVEHFMGRAKFAHLYYKLVKLKFPSQMKHQM